ncbi:unnamed protein product, partial [Strongylus vulgaris]
MPLWGTSHATKLKRQMNKSAMKPSISSDTEDKENQNIDPVKPNQEVSLMEILKDVRSSLEELKTHDVERAEEIRSIRRLVDDRGKEMDKLRGIVADFFAKDCPPSIDSLSHSLSEKKKDEQKKSPPRKAADPKNKSPLSPDYRRCSPSNKDLGNK